jgi:hypothetical protein
MSFGSDMIYYTNLQAFVDWQMFDNKKIVCQSEGHCFYFKSEKLLEWLLEISWKTQGEMDYDNQFVENMQFLVIFSSQANCIREL